MSKSGVLGLSKGLSKAYGGEGVLVNAVSPAFIQSPMTAAMMQQPAQAVQAFLREERPFLVLRRRGKPEEVASVITGSWYGRSLGARNGLSAEVIFST